MEVSIILGTWNRLEALQSSIYHIRDSVGTLEYEVIIVDGGSTDGTLEWLEGQDDCLVVKQKRLVGACRAFTAGFRLALAPFVVHLNDDDEPQGDCIHTAYEYMKANPDVGQVAFAFDLYTPGEYHLDHVFGDVYANKGMTRREAGDGARWWSDEFHTYGGDCELSCRVRELGYRVVGLPECRAHDLMTDDALRKVNNPGGVNPDSEKFYAQRKGIIPIKQRHRVLHVALNYGSDNQPALQRALQSLGEYQQVDWMRLGKQTEEVLAGICREWNPDLVFMQLQTPGIVSPIVAKGIQAMGRTVVNWSGDVRDPLPEWYFDLGKEVDWTLVTNTDWVEKLQSKGVNAEYLQIGFNQEIFHPWGDKAQSEPIVFMGNHYGDMFPLSKDRLNMVRYMQEVFRDDFQVYGRGWPFRSQHLGWYEEASHYRGCKIAIGMSQLKLRRYTSDRLHRAMGSGAFYLPQWYPGIELEFEQGVHLDWWQDVGELEEKVKYYLENKSIRQRIAFQGSECVHEKHTWLDRVYELRRIIGWHKWR